MTKQQKIKKYFNQKAKLSIKNPEYLKQLKKCTIDLMEKDLTSDILIKKNNFAKAAIYAKEKGIIAGIEEVGWFLNKNHIKFKKYCCDGDKVKKNEVIFEIKGKIKDILKVERIALNLMQRMSGIATHAKKMNKKNKYRSLLCPTRKVLYGLLDKKAVTIGSGGTHRLGLHDFILIKDNHLEFLKNNIDKSAKKFNHDKLFWEIEIKEKNQAYWAATLMPSAIMFDNFKPKKIKKIINKLKPLYPNIIFEASGQINLKNIKKYRKCNLDIISSGSLTHSVKALDISLDIL